MASRASLNKVLLIGNLTRDPELRYTPSGAAVCTFGIATNRSYTASDGTKKEEVEFTKIVSWNKLGELCNQLLRKGRKVYVEGRMQTRSWETPDGQNRQTTEVVIDDMRILDSKPQGFDDQSGSEPFVEVSASDTEAPIAVAASVDDDEPISKAKTKKSEDKAEKKTEAPAESQEVDLDDLPF